MITYLPISCLSESWYSSRLFRIRPTIGVCEHMRRYAGEDNKINVVIHLLRAECRVLNTFGTQSLAAHILYWLDIITRQR